MIKYKKILLIINNFILIPLIGIIIFHVIYIMNNNYGNFGVSFKTFFLSLIIIDSIILLIFSITKKTNISIMITFILLIVIYIINQMKIIYMETPLFLQDFNFIKNSSNIMTMTKGSIFSNIIKILPMIIFMSLFLSLIFLYASKIKIVCSKKKNRILLNILGCVLLFFLFFPFSWSKTLYLKLFFIDQEKKDYSSYTNYNEVYNMYGVIGGLYHQILNSRFTIPSNYNEDKLNKILKESDKKIKKGKNIGNPNIIIILSESFFDVEKIHENITFEPKITSNFNKLSKEGKLVDLISPTYGGMTGNVTFELLTGGKMNYFPVGYIPFMQLYNGNNTSPSIVNDLKKSGYLTKIELAEDSYDSSLVFSKIGFDQYSKFKATKNNRKGFFLSDDYVADNIIKNLKKNSGKKFYMVETMQSHMEYPIFKYNTYDIKVKSSNLLKDDTNTLLSYAQGIYDADQMLEKVYNYIKSTNDDTILIFFGDHLPYLKNSKGSNILNKLKYFNTKNEITNTYRKYNTQALILSNFSLNLDFPKKMGVDLLLPFLINSTDIKISSYYNYLYNSIDILPAYNNFIFVDSNGKISDLKNLEGKELDTYNTRNSFMYQEFIRNKVSK